MQNNVLISTQDFGMGGAAIVQQIITSMSPQKINYKYLVPKSGRCIHSNGNNTIDIVDLYNKENIKDSIAYHQCLQQYLLENETQLVHQTSFAFSVYDHLLIAWAWMHDIPRLAVDTQPWFWKIQQSITYQQSKLKKLQKIKQQKNTKELFTYIDSLFYKNPHEAIFLLHLLSETSLVQGSKHTCPFLDELKHAKLYNPIEFGIISDQAEKDSTYGQYILVQISGGDYPILTYEEELDYAEIIFKLVNHFSQKYFSHLQWKLLMRQEYIDGLKLRNIFHPNKNLSISPPVDNKTNIHLIRNAKLCLISAGLLSVHEAAKNETPVFFIPEQHAGKLEYQQFLQKQNYPVVSCSVNHLLDENTKNLPNEIPIARKMYQLYRQNKSTITQITNPFYDQMNSMLTTISSKNQRYLSKVAQKQQQTIATISGGMNGKETILTTFLDMLQSPTMTN